ncbi:hypothetical protein V5799_026614 [Amblyomma americanum]|uniref:Uncharacterized protein n=1 Tax=Amblyomma americanum TaxID=6943 RepID=A0AAQ4DI24_AMBAM
MEVEVKANHSPGGGKLARKKRLTKKVGGGRKSIVATTAEEHGDGGTPPRSDQTPDSQSGRTTARRRWRCDAARSTKQGSFADAAAPLCLEKRIPEVTRRRGAPQERHRRQTKVAVPSRDC